MKELVFTEGPDGQVFASLPRAEGPKSLAFEATGAAAEFLRRSGHTVRIVVENLDGGAFSENGREVVTAAVEAEARGEDPWEAAAAVHFQRAAERLDAKDVSTRKAG